MPVNSENPTISYYHIQKLVTDFHEKVCLNDFSCEDNDSSNDEINNNSHEEESDKENISSISSRDSDHDDKKSNDSITTPKTNEIETKDFEENYYFLEEFGSIISLEDVKLLLDSYPTEKLESEVQSYGYKPSSRDHMIDFLTRRF